MSRATLAWPGTSWQWGVGAALLLFAAACSTSASADQPSGASTIGGAAVLEKYCAKCHAAKSEGDFGFVTDTKRLVAEGYLVPGDAAKSVIVQRIVDGEMPPAGVKVRPSQAEIAALRTWVDAMAAGDRSVPFRREAEVARLLAADEARLSYDARTHARWFTLTHLANAGVPDAQLDTYRVALEALLASLTWSASAPAVTWIDPERTIYRVDLRELGWTTAQWDVLRASYPYGVARGTRAPDAVRADWFVATASRPPLYHALLGLPDSEAELAQRLGIDLAGDIEHGRVARAAFNRSGVSVNNRVIERHDTRYGAYWRSYDFASSVGRENVFQHPMAFVPAGGEIIFNLPDGFQAYMLVDAHGKRIDKAPTAIVSDARRLDRAVENGVSCMGCHASGIVAKQDQLRQLASTLDRHDRDRVLRLHPTTDAMAKLYAADRERFATAFAAIKAKPAADTADEPINLLVGRYEAELDLKLAAAELGLLPDELASRMEWSGAQIRQAYGRNDASLTQSLGALARTGGTIKRDTWSTVFPRLVDQLGVGVPFTPHGSFDAAPAVWLDRGRATWIVGVTATDQDRARRLCRDRGYDLPRTDELRAAVASGLAVGLQQRRTLWTRAVKIDANNLRYAAVVDATTGVARRADLTDRHDAVCVKR